MRELLEKFSLLKLRESYAFIGKVLTGLSHKIGTTTHKLVTRDWLLSLLEETAHFEDLAQLKDSIEHKLKK